MLQTKTFMGIVYWESGIGPIPNPQSPFLYFFLFFKNR